MNYEFYDLVLILSLIILLFKLKILLPKCSVVIIEL